MSQEKKAPQTVASHLPPLFRTLNERAKATIAEILTECGVDAERFLAAGDGELEGQDLRNAMGSVWVQHARAASLEKVWLRQQEEQQSEYDRLFAGAYFNADDILGPKATEGKKKHWVILNTPEVVEAESLLAQTRFIASMCGVARKSLEIRVNTLQSINKLIVAELENLHVHLDSGSEVGQV